MANADVPVPNDLRIVRTRADVIEARFTSVRSDLLYMLRFGSESGSNGGEWWSMLEHVNVGPHPEGVEVVVPIGPDVPNNVGVPTATTERTHFKISARDPALYDPTLDNWQVDSFVYPPGNDGSGNWGQGPGIIVTWQDWVEPVPVPTLPPPALKLAQTDRDKVYAYWPQIDDGTGSVAAVEIRWGPADLFSWSTYVGARTIRSTEIVVGKNVGVLIMLNSDVPVGYRLAVQAASSGNPSSRSGVAVLTVQAMTPTTPPPYPSTPPPVAPPEYSAQVQAEIAAINARRDELVASGFDPLVAEILSQTLKALSVNSEAFDLGSWKIHPEGTERATVRARLLVNTSSGVRRTHVLVIVPEGGS